MSLKFEKFLLFGDSITEYSFDTRMSAANRDEFTLGAALVKDYIRRLDIVPRGFSGYTSRWALKLLPKILEQEQDISISTVFFGSNDSCEHEHQHVPLDEYRNNISKLIKMLKAKNIKVIVIGPSLYDAENWYSTHPEESGTGYIRSSELFKKYSDAAAQAAAEQNVPFVNLHDAFKKSDDDWRSLLWDGLHYSGKGYEVMYNALKKTIAEHYPEYAAENVEYKYPYFRDIEANGNVLEEYIHRHSKE